MSENVETVKEEFVNVTPEPTNTTYVVLPDFRQTLVNTASTMVAGAIIGAGLNVLGGAASAAGKKIGNKIGTALKARKQRKALKKAEKEVIAELAQEKASPENENDQE